jgi:riboflavin kinase/FMN adenylyltransferase
MVIAAMPDVGQSLDEGDCVVAIGCFDGVHLGHQSLVRSAARVGERSGLPLHVVTFEPHPQRHLRRKLNNFRLSSLSSKIVRLETLGARQTCVLEFNDELAKMPAKEFVADVLVAQMRARHVVVGEDFCFGSGRSGNISNLRTWQQAMGFKLIVADTIVSNGSRISSTAVRNALQMGNVCQANQLLGYSWEIELQRIDSETYDLGEYTSPLPGIYNVRVSGNNLIKHRAMFYVENGRPFCRLIENDDMPTEGATLTLIFNQS